MNWEKNCNSDEERLIEQGIRERLESGYATVRYLARDIDVSERRILAGIDSMDDVRKSSLKTRDGRDVYCLKSRFGWLRDFVTKVQQVSVWALG